MASKKDAVAAAGGVAAAPVLREVERVPASRPYIDGLEESYIKSLLERNDATTSLATMLDEEVLTVAELSRRKAKEEKAGKKWEWDAGLRLKRLELILAKKPVGDDMRPPSEVSGDRPGSFIQRLKLVKQRPRGPGVCGWAGYDADENVYMCGRFRGNALGPRARANPRALTRKQTRSALPPPQV